MNQGNQAFGQFASMFDDAFGAFMGQGFAGAPAGGGSPPGSGVDDGDGGTGKPPPPAALSYINSLREQVITSDDLIEENNKECLICLDENRLGGKAVKLPCGHLYHKECITEWLRKQGSCPVCRYEVESSDIMYERKRKYKMNATRKLRMRREELKAKKIPELRQIARQLSIDISGCIDKKEITDLLFAQEDKFDFTEGVPVQEIDEETFQNKSVKELRQLLLSFGISDEGMLDKNELRDALVESGRIELVSAKKEESQSEGEESHHMDIHREDTRKESGEGAEMEVDAACGMPSSAAAPVPAPAPAPTTTSAPRGNDPNVLELGLAVVKSMSIRELKAIMEAYHIPTQGCLEREDLLQRLDEHPGVSLLEG